MKRRSKVMRADEGLLNDFDDVRAFRVANKMDRPRELSDREITRMMRNALNYPALINELKFKPRRKNGR